MRIETKNFLASSFSKESNEITAKLKQPDPNIKKFIKELQAPDLKIQEAIRKFSTETPKLDLGPKKYMEKTFL